MGVLLADKGYDANYLVEAGEKAGATVEYPLGLLEKYREGMIKSYTKT